jgi:carboxylesterase type B
MIKAVLYGLIASLASQTLAGPLHQRASSPPTVQIANGTIQGLHLDSYNQDLFLGVPFAQPPTWPNLRFKNPVGLNQPYRNTLQATRYAPMCIGYGVRYSDVNDRALRSSH